MNIASMAGLTSPPYMAPYNVAKHGVVALSESMYLELKMAAPTVGVTVVCPGWVRTQIHKSIRHRPSADTPVSDAGVGDADAGFEAIVLTVDRADLGGMENMKKGISPCPPCWRNRP